MLAKTIIIPAKGRAEVIEEELDTSNLQPNEAVIQAEASMISAGTELSRVFEIKKGFSYPVRPGYSAVGKILAKGSDLTDLQIGDRVFYTGPHTSLCRFSRGTRTQGPMIFKLPEGISSQDGTLITQAMVAISGVNSVEVRLGDRIGVFGMGLIGLLAAIMLKKLGAEVVAIDPVTVRCEHARQMGIMQLLDCPPQEQLAQIQARFGGLDAAVDVTGSARAIETAVLACKKYGQVALLGTPRAACMLDVTPMLSAIHMRMLRVTGAFNSLEPVFESEGMRLNVQRNFGTICDMILSRELPVSWLISHVVSPEEVERAYHGLMYKPELYRCVVIDWTN
ncbi:MAG: zinc-binding alcohol dehydrogenase [Chloroflexi bacterium]|jgi:2-desacetyl-2-hydroxyethyl bacteriochlorophyllide A dehydrogenase|nr:zinc-binding alcohol dehydrogenase [Chloroflexota bacterium]